MDLRDAVLRTSIIIVMISFVSASLDPNTLRRMSPEERMAHVRQQQIVKGLSKDASGDDMENGQSLLLEGNAEFALRLYKTLSSNLGPTENLVFSPLNIAISMAKLGFGAKGDTEQEIRETLAYPDVEFAEDLAYELADGIERVDQLKDVYPFLMADGIFIDEQLNILDSFLNNLEEHFIGSIEHLEKNNKKNSINSWLSEESDGELKELPFTVDETSRLVCANVMLFDNVWDKKFDPTQTEEGDFLMANGESMKIPFMKQSHRFLSRHLSQYDVKMIELPLLNREMSMFIFMPLLSEKGSEDVSSEETLNFEDHMTARFLSNPHRAFKTFYIELKTQLSLPKFSFHQTHDLAHTMKALGLSALFTEGADLSGMVGSENVFVNHLLHTTSINVDETGSDEPTESIIGDANLASMQKQDVIFTADRPFIFFIKENKSKDILLMGKINNPKSNMNTVINNHDHKGL